MTIQQGFDSHYSYVLVAARRARQLQNGSRPLVDSRSSKASRIAQDEIAAGKIAFVKPDVPILKPEVKAPIIPILPGY
jgi:DNA-directed RNA polymerase subunit omega